jgi:hypothetical protein
MDTNLWKVDYNNYKEQIISCIKICEEKKLSLLDTSKHNFDLIEKVVYEISMFHFEKIKINFDPNEHFIEFWFKNSILKNNEISSNNINSFHYDCDEDEKKINNKQFKPLLSCVNYFNDNDFPLLLTEIDLDEYKFKKFENKNNVQIIFPKTNKQITFDGTKFHGVIDIFNKLNDDADSDFERYMLAINLWNKKPLNIPYYKNSSEIENTFTKDDKIVTIEENNVVKELSLELEKNILNFDFYEKMLYNTKKFTIPQEISELVKNELNEFSNFKIIYKTPEKSLTEKEIFFSKMVKDINNITTFDKNNNEQMDILYNRFIQRFTYNKIFSKNVCEWIIFESENYAKNNGGWTTRRHENYPTTDIPIEKIPGVFNFVLNSFEGIFNKIKKSYCFTEEVLFNINDLFIVKYNEEIQNKLDLHHDGSFLSINILLSDPKDFEGGGTYFNDGLTAFLEQGDLLVHSGKIEHSGLPVTKGTRYILVSFIGIKVKLNNIENNLLIK